MNISSWSIKNPVPPILLFALLIILGLLGFHKLGIENFPDIELPSVVVSTTLEGAAPAQMETEVTRKIEDAVAGIDGVEEIVSGVSQGYAYTLISFKIEKDTEIAVNETRNAIDSIRSSLPANVTTPTVSKVTTTGAPILTFTVQSSQLGEEELSWFVDNELNKALLGVKGVGKVNRIGGVDREVAINLDPVKMAALGVTAGDISARVKQVQQDTAGGTSDLGAGSQSVRTLAAVGTVDEIANIEIPTSAGKRVKLNEVASVQDTIAERHAYAFLSTKQEAKQKSEHRTVIGFSINRTKGTSEVTVSKAVREALNQIQNTHPSIQIQEAFNTVDAVEDNYNGSMMMLYEGALLTILVVFLFLRDFRATIIAAVALPLSIIPVFFVIQKAGFSINILTLLSLALVVGILVDDAIVEIENIVRHLKMGKTPFQAAMEAADEIGMAVITTTSALVAVFLPTALMGGVIGKFFVQFGWTAVAAILASLIVARMITPMMAACFLKPIVREHKDGFLMKGYLKLVRWCLKYHYVTITFSALFIAGSFYLTTHLDGEFIPSADRNQTQIAIELPPGSSLEQTRIVAEQARDIALAIPDVKKVFSSVGNAATDGSPFAIGGGGDPRKATLALVLTHRNERACGCKQIEIEKRLRKELKHIPGARIAVGLGDNKKQLALTSDDAVLLNQVSTQLVSEIRTIPGLGNISSTASLARPEVHIIPDNAKAAEMGVTTAAIADAIRLATSGDYDVALPKLNLPQRQIPVRVRLDKPFREDLRHIENLQVPSKVGFIPLASIATVKLGSGPSSIQRLNRKQNVLIDVELNGVKDSVVMEQISKLPTMKNLPKSVESPLFGSSKNQADMGVEFASAMLLGLVCIYIVIVLLFHDFLQPVTILMALPLAIGGAFISLLLTNNGISMPSLIGLLMLMGIVTKNSILLVEYTIVARKERGMSRFDALIDACHKRAQPILMTTIAMAAGMLPTALGLGAEPSFRSPMAIVVVGGLISSTLLCLIVIPVVYLYVDVISQGLSKLFSKKQRKHEVIEESNIPQAVLVPESLEGHVRVSTQGIAENLLSVTGSSDVMERGEYSKQGLLILLDKIRLLPSEGITPPTLQIYATGDNAFLNFSLDEGGFTSISKGYNKLTAEQVAEIVFGE